MSSSEMSDHEVFENTFYYFVAALRILSSDAATQCKDLDNYNTPSEIQSETATRGLGTLRVSAHYLDWKKAEVIVDLGTLPINALPFDRKSAAGRMGAIAHRMGSWGVLLWTVRCGLRAADRRGATGSARPIFRGLFGGSLAGRCRLQGSTWVTRATLTLPVSVRRETLPLPTPVPPVNLSLGQFDGTWSSHCLTVLRIGARLD